MICLVAHLVATSCQRTPTVAISVSTLHDHSPPRINLPLKPTRPSRTSLVDLVDLLEYP